LTVSAQRDPSHPLLVVFYIVRRGQQNRDAEASGRSEEETFG